MKTQELSLQIPVTILKEDNSFVAYSPALDLSTCGKTYEEARRRFGEITSIFVKETVAAGTLESVLLDLGWQKVKTRWLSPMIVGTEIGTINLPVTA